MNFPFFIAKRYFFSRKNPSAINIITFISVLGYAVGSFALIILLSALNGFEKVIFQVYDTYYPDLKIQAVSGKVFHQDSLMLEKIKKSKGVTTAVFCLEENAIIRNEENQIVGLIKGVGNEYTKVVKTDSLVVAGGVNLTDKNGALGWMAQGLLYKLNIGKNSNHVNLLAPRRESVGVSQMEMHEEDLRISSMINPGDEMNQKLLITSLSFSQELFERDSQVSSIEVKINKASQKEEIAENMQTLLGKKFIIKNRTQQNEAVYKMFNTEKWVAFAIMTFVLLLITFNLLGSLSMLVLEKKQDIFLLKAVGLGWNKIKKIFFFEGAMVAVFGSMIGVIAGITLVLLQAKYGFVTTNATFVNAYPVELRITDILMVLGLCAVLGITGAIYPAIRSAELKQTVE